MTDDPDRARGLYGKFNVTRADGSSAPGGKHHECEYFVLDLTHDPHVKTALAVYANEVEATYPQLAEDMRRKYGLDSTVELRGVLLSGASLRAALVGAVALDVALRLPANLAAPEATSAEHGFNPDYVGGWNDALATVREELPRALHETLGAALEGFKDAADGAKP